MKANILGGKYVAKLKFPGGLGGGSNYKTFHGRGMEILWNNTF